MLISFTCAMSLSKQSLYLQKVGVRLCTHLSLDSTCTTTPGMWYVVVVKKDGMIKIFSYHILSCGNNNIIRSPMITNQL